MCFDYPPGIIRDIALAYAADGSKSVPHGDVIRVPTAEVLAYRKFPRTRARALAPGRVRNRTQEDVAAGHAKWDELVRSMREEGFRESEPVEFMIGKQWPLRLHQGHHRVGVADLLGISPIPVRIWYAELWRAAR